MFRRDANGCAPNAATGAENLTNNNKIENAYKFWKSLKIDQIIIFKHFLFFMFCFHVFHDLYDFSDFLDFHDFHDFHGLRLLMFFVISYDVHYF